ncbi:MAG: ATP-dependent 6-phosphofructokinase, partial [Ruminococcaceae bacterium]|nr:ATP-dependent 6-phosphofructokinase [Oscillospiraceae bacterium]
GGTILGTSRTPYRNMRVIEADNVDKVAAMKRNYAAMGLDCLVTLGGNGTHKTANLLAEEGLNIIGLPKTIDNDIFGTDVTFGFHSAVDIATDVVDRIHTTANSHGRVMVIELMGNKAGWLTLYAGLGGGADIILLPEIPYDVDKVMEAIERRTTHKRNFAIVCIAEGAMTVQEAQLKKKALEQQRAQQHFISVGYQLAAEIERRSKIEARVVVPGHYQRGGSPSPYDRVLATQFGAYAAQLIRDGSYGCTVAMNSGAVCSNRLSDIAGKTKFVPADCGMIATARAMGVSFGD